MPKSNENDVALNGNSESFDAENSIDGNTESLAEDNDNNIVSDGSQDLDPSPYTLYLDGDTVDDNEDSESVEIPDSEESDEDENPEVPEPPSIKERLVRFNERLEKNGITVGNMVMRIIAAFFFANSYWLYKSDVTRKMYKSLDLVRQSKVKTVIVSIVVSFLLLSVLYNLVTAFFPRRKISTDAYGMALSLFIYTFLTLWKNDDFYYSVGIVIILSAITYYLVKNNLLKELHRINTPTSVIIVALGAAIMCAFVGTMCVMRYRIYYASTFDLGIAGQMYHYMKETFQPLTTCERDRLLSHFAVHITPVYYLLLPVFMIFPYMETLLISQPIILALGVIPLYLICKNRKFSPASTTCISLAYLYSMAIVAPNFYDFHENAFIPPLMLAFFYFMEKRKWLGMYIFLFLTLSCKEDVSVSMACVGMFMFFAHNKKNRKQRLDGAVDDDPKYNKVKWHGIIVAILSLMYFAAATWLLKKYGEGTFSHRFNSLMVDPDAGLGQIIITAVTNPGFLLTEAFKEEKFIFMLQLMLPFAFFPFLSKKGGNFLLLVPTFLVCMLPDYYYQHNIDFQYVFGMVPMLIYATVINVSDMNKKIRKFALPFMAITAITMTFAHMTPRADYLKYYKDNDKTRIEIYEKYLSMIPDEASVECTHIFVPRLSMRKEVYMTPGDINNHKWDDCDYVVLKVGGISSEDAEYNEKRIEYMMENGYVYAFGDANYIAVYQKIS